MEFSIKIETEEGKFCQLSLSDGDFFRIQHTDLDGTPIQFNEPMDMNIDEIIKALNILKENESVL